MDPSYDNVKPLVAATQPEASYLLVTFRCPATGFEIRGEGAWPADGLIETQAKVAKRSLFSSIRNTVASQVRTAAGNQLAGSTAGSAAANVVQYAGNDGSSQPAKHSDKDAEKATLAAFEKVAGSFRWDDDDGRWVAATAAEVETSPFTDHLTAHPITEDYDRDLVARLLAALVASDGQVSDDERAAFAALAPGADLDALSARRAPSGVDFEESRMGPTRETMLLLGWAVALSDESLAEAEAALLQTAATGLGIAEARGAELKEIAQRHIVEEAIQTMDRDGASVDQIRDVVEPLGEQIGLGADEAARVVIRWSKRND